MSENPEEPAAPDSESAKGEGEKRSGSDAPALLSSKPPVSAPPRPESNAPGSGASTPAPGASTPLPAPSGPPRPSSQSPVTSSPPPRPRSSRPPPGSPSARVRSSRPPAGSSGPPRARLQSSPEGLAGERPRRAPSSPIPASPNVPSFPPVSQPPNSIIDTERQTPVPGVSPEAMAQMPATPPLPKLDLNISSLTPPTFSEPPLSGPLGQAPEPSPFETALVGAAESIPPSIPPSEPPEPSDAVPPAPAEEVPIVNPIRAMRVIRIEETKKRSPSAPVLETAETSFEDIEQDLDVTEKEALAAAPLPDDVEPISEVEPIVDFEAPDPTDPIEVDVEHVESPSPPPAPSTAPTLPGQASAAPTPAGRESQPDIPPADRKPPPPRRSTRPALPKAKHPRKKPWWETIFGDDFSRAYRPMTEKQLAREVDFILDGLRLPKGAVILDLACGQGEICVELARRGYSVVGYDLSVYQLAMAGDNAQQAKQKINFLQGDMREMAFEEMFDAIICWDTSFGYFEDDKNLDVLLRAKKALKPGGRLLLDVMNRDFAAREAPYNHWFEGDGCVCMDDMGLDWITNRLTVKRSIILDDGRSKELQYSTRLYTLSELGRMLHEVGFRVSAVSGDTFTKGAFFGPHSRRIIIQSGKP